MECEACLAIFVVVVGSRKVGKQPGHAGPDSREIDPQALRDGIVCEQSPVQHLSSQTPDAAPVTVTLAANRTRRS